MAESCRSHSTRPSTSIRSLCLCVVGVFNWLSRYEIKVYGLYALTVCWQKAEAQKYFAQVVDSFAELADATHAHCFGTAICAVVDYLTLRSAQPPIVMGACSAVKEQTFPDVRYHIARILSFLSSAPSYGLGAVAPSTMSDVQATSEFYTSIATKAVKVGARIDLIGLGQAIGLSQLRPLAQVTGGNILLYLDLQTATLPQDLYIFHFCSVLFRFDQRLIRGVGIVSCQGTRAWEVSCAFELPQTSNKTGTLTRLGH